MLTSPLITRAPTAPPPDEPAPSRPPRGTGRLTAALAPAGLMLALGLWGIRRQNTMWRDESTTYQVAHRSVPEIWHMLGSADAAHGLYYLLMHAVFTLWDGGLLALRLPSVLAMAAAAAGVGLLGRRLAGGRAGLMAGLAFPLLPIAQHYAQEGRSYALVCALVVWATWLLTSAVARPRARTWAGYAAVLATACVLHEFAVLALLAHGLTLLLARVPRALLWTWAQAATWACVPLLPVAVISQQQAALVAWIGPPNPFQLLTFALSAALGWACARTPAARVPMARPVRGVRVVPGDRPAGAHLTPRTLALPLLLLPTLLLLAVWPIHPFYLDRYVLYSYAGLALLLGAGMDHLSRAAVRRGPLRVGMVAGLAAVVLAGTVPVDLALRTPRSRLDDPVSAARAVRELSSPGDGVVFLPARRREPIRSRPQDFRGLRELALARDAVSSGTLFGVELPPGTIRSRMLATERIIAVGDPPGQPRDKTPGEAVKWQTLHRYFTVCARRPVTGMVVTLWARPGGC